jgi:hypothetical protein
MRRPSGGCRVEPTKEKEMSMQDRRRPLRGRAEPEPANKPSAEELAARHKLALLWRDEWRAKTPVGMEPPAQPALSVRKPAEHETSIVAGTFAAAIARAEFGRFYWNEKLDDQLKAAMQPRSKDESKNKRNGKIRR